MKPVRAWAITDKGLGTLSVFDYRAPVYWYKQIATQERNLMDRHGRIVRVEIREVPSKPRKKRRT